MLAQATKNDTTALLDDSRQIKEGVIDVKGDTVQLLRELKTLKASLPGDVRGPTYGGVQDRRQAIEEYLDSITSYAETVVDDVEWSDEDSTVGVVTASDNRTGSYDSHGDTRYKSQGDYGDPRDDSSKCAVCEDSLEHTLRGERILHFPCSHASHEACFNEYTKEFESSRCPTCNAELDLDIGKKIASELCIQFRADDLRVTQRS